MYFPIHSRPSLLAASTLLLSARLPASDLTEDHMQHFFYCGPEAEPSALIGFEPCGSVALMRSLVVTPELRARGVGRRLVAHAESEARSLGIAAMYLLTTTAEGFFSRLGYLPVTRDDVPQAIRATKEFSSICPASSALLTKTL